MNDPVHLKWAVTVVESILHTFLCGRTKFCRQFHSWDILWIHSPLPPLALLMDIFLPWLAVTRSAINFDIERLQEAMRRALPLSTPRETEQSIRIRFLAQRVHNHTWIHVVPAHCVHFFKYIYVFPALLLHKYAWIYVPPSTPFAWVICNWIWS